MKLISRCIEAHGSIELITRTLHRRLPETKMFKDVVGRLSAAFKAEKTARMPAAVMVQVEGRQARSKAPESVFAGNRATALQLARSVVPVVTGDEAKKMAEKVMVRQSGELEASHPSSPIPSMATCVRSCRIAVCAGWSD